MPSCTLGFLSDLFQVCRKRRLIAIVSASLVLLMTSRSAAAQDSIAVVLAEQAQMRDVPTITGVVRAVLLRGDTVRVKRREGYWLMVEFATREGFIRTAQLSDLFIFGGAPTPQKREATPEVPVIASAPVTTSVPTPTTKPVPKSAPAAKRTTKPPAKQSASGAAVKEQPADSQRVSYVTPAFGNPSMRFPVAPAASQPVAEPAPDTTPLFRPTMRVEIGYVHQNISVSEALGGPGAVPAAADQPAGGKSGHGVDLQLRARFRFLSLGVGYARTSHAAASGDRETWSGPFVEPRLDWAVLRSLDVTVGMRAGLLVGSFERDTTVGESVGRTELLTRARHVTGLVGLRYHLRERVAFDVQAGYGRVPVSKTEVTTTTTRAGQRIEQRAITNIGRSGDIGLLRFGVTLGF